MGSVGTVLGGYQSPEGRIRGFREEGPAGAEEFAGAEDIARRCGNSFSGG